MQALLNMHQGRFDLKSKLREGTEAIAYLPTDRVSKRMENAPSLEPDYGDEEDDTQAA